ncbi:hypothetical protein C6376_39180 [Streptomyces sp. P3]|nr:hypothetical protein C6376_38880 [Streptomyces sp. P3]AVV46498.1 hypothetical protein C6376_39180 [Streptomyces sp. P3]
MSPRGASLQQIADMLRDGATYLQVKEQLHVSSRAIKEAREAYGVPVSPRAIDELPPEQQRAAITARYPRVAAMLREGTTPRQIMAAGIASRSTVYKVRAVLQTPGERRAGTVAEALARYTEPTSDGHARWTGPTTRADGTGQPRLWAHNRRHTPRREAFRAHHHRAPEGPVTATCTYPGCIAGPHLADEPIRQAAAEDARLNAQFDAIFGTNAP